MVLILLFLKGLCILLVVCGNEFECGDILLIDFIVFFIIGINKVGRLFNIRSRGEC